MNLNHNKCTSRWNFLLGTAACRTSSSAHVSAAGSSARNHHSPVFLPFNPGTSPGGGAVTGTSPCYPHQQPLWLLMGLVVLSPAPVLPPEPEPKADFFSLLCQFKANLHWVDGGLPASLSARSCLSRSTLVSHSWLGEKGLGVSLGLVYIRPPPSVTKLMWFSAGGDSLLTWSWLHL